MVLTLIVGLLTTTSKKILLMLIPVRLMTAISNAVDEKLTLRTVVGRFLWSFLSEIVRKRP